MNTTVRVPSYPLEAVRQRERWKLEALQLRLARASVEQRQLAEEHRTVVGTVGSAVTIATVTAGAIIDPAGADRRLRSIEQLQAAVAAAARTLELAGAAVTALRLALDAQRIRLESIERHRQAFARQAARDAQRRQGVETERAWLARSAWQAGSANQSGRASAASSSMLGDPRT